MRCQQYQPLIADRCPGEAICNECDRCKQHCFCDTMDAAILALRKSHSITFQVLDGTLMSPNEAATEIRVTDTITLWDAGIQVSDDEFENDLFKV
jgi:hypothetical protein